MTAATKSTPKRLATFCEALSEHGSVTVAAEAAGMDRSSAYKVRHRDPAFAEAWDDALQQAMDKLEREVFRRAYQGYEKPIYQQGREVGKVTEYSDTLAMFLLNGNRPEKYKNRTEHSGDPKRPMCVKTIEMSDAELLAVIAEPEKG